MYGRNSGRARSSSPGPNRQPHPAPITTTADGLSSPPLSPVPRLASSLDAQHLPHPQPQLRGQDRDRLASAPFTPSLSSAPPMSDPASRIPRRENVPRRSSTLGSPEALEREKDYLDLERERGAEQIITRLHTLPASAGGPRSRSITPQGGPQSPRSRASPPTPVVLSSSHPSPHEAPSTPTLTHQGSSSSSNATYATADSTPRPPSVEFERSAVAAPAQPICCSCNTPMTGQFVRALGNVYHLDCFRCRDCDRVVAQKFFPIEGVDGRQQPLCERDYFRRLNLICGKCGQALRGSYITACNKKFHVEHFSCSVCPTLFGPSDSYYEHAGDVYCHLHYSTRFATKCVGCGSAILKQFVEINRNQRDECWHPECYMIHKFWNVKMTSRLPPSPIPPSSETDPSEGPQPSYAQEEATETAASLKAKQKAMETQVYRIWTVLSAFEESSATCISDMLRHVSNGQWLSAIRSAEKFILHVEVLFAAMDDLEAQFARVNVRGMSHVREARMLCRKTVDLFTLLSRTEATTDRRMRFTEELLALVTGLAHYLKILIRIALTGSLKLEREHSDREAGANLLDKLQALTRDGANPMQKRATKALRGGSMPGTQGVVYGYRCLAPEHAGSNPFAPGAPSDAANMEAPSDLCVECKITVEEDCVRLGTYLRWHSQCVRCGACGRTALPPNPKEKPPASGEEGAPAPPKFSSSRRPPALVQDFVYKQGEDWKPTTLGEPKPAAVFCIEHGTPECKVGFEAVSKLEQFAFLLNVALRRLYILLTRKGWMTVSMDAASTSESSSEDSRSMADSYRDSTEIMRLKSVHLDRKLSATARLPKRSTIVESPSGKIAQPTDATVHSSLASRIVDEHLQGGSVQPAPIESFVTAVQTPSPPRAQVIARPQPQYAPSSSRPSAHPTGVPGQALSQISTRPMSVSPGPITPGDDGVAVIRPSFARNNTSVRIIFEDGNASTRNTHLETIQDVEGGFPVDEDGITLADIPQMMEAEQAREQHRSLPRQGGKPLICELTPLELLVVKHFAVLQLHKSPLRDQFDLDEILELVEVKNKTFWNKLFKGEKKNVKKKGAFGVPLELLVEREGVDSLLGASRTPLRVPSFLDDLISAMKQMDMSVEGVFRKNGNIRKLKDLADNIDRDPASVDLSAENPVQLAALLKKFLGDLPDPLLTFKLHRLLCHTQKFSNADDRKKYLHLVSILLPKYHRDTMEVIFVFLKWVASFSHIDEETGSKMDLQNLATVVSPSILYAKGRDPAKDEIFLAIRVVAHLLEQQDDFYNVPDDISPVLNDMEYFANCSELPRKEILKKCETYWKLKHPKGGANGILPPSNSFGSNGSRTDSGDVRLNTRRSDPALSNRPSPSHAPQPNGVRQPPGGAQGSHPNYSQEILSQSLGSWEDISTPNMFAASPPDANGYMPPLGSRNTSYDNQPRGNQSRHPDARWNGSAPARSQPGSRPTSYIRTDTSGFPPTGRQSPAIHSRS